MNNAPELARPPALFIQIWPLWEWLPLVSVSDAGVIISWGPFLCGYIRSSYARALRARAPHDEGESK